MNQGPRNNVTHMPPPRCPVIIKDFFGERRCNWFGEDRSDWDDWEGVNEVLDNAQNAIAKATPERRTK